MITAKQTVALLANIKPYHFSRAHVFYIDSEFDPKTEAWRTILPALNSETPPEGETSLGPVFRILGCLWLGRHSGQKTTPFYHSLN